MIFFSFLFFCFTMQAGQSHEGRGMFSSDASKPIGPSPRRHSSTREFQLPGRLSRNHSTCGESPVVVQRSHSNSCSTSVSASSGQGHKNIVSALPEKRVTTSFFVVYIAVLFPPCLDAFLGFHPYMFFPYNI